MTTELASQPPPDTPAVLPPAGIATSRVGATSAALGTSDAAGAAAGVHDGGGDGAGHAPGIASPGLTLAAAPAASPLIARCDAAHPGRDGRRLRILVTDDDAFAARLMRRLLEQDGHAVRTAGTLREALALADAGPVDVLITDYLLPDGTGCELLRALRSRGAVAAISITGFHDPEHARHIAAAGFDERFVKPIILSQLTAAIAQVGAVPGGSRPVAG
jgi:CheY-like chemotaxis protein